MGRVGLLSNFSTMRSMVLAALLLLAVSQVSCLYSSHGGYGRYYSYRGYGGYGYGGYGGGYGGYGGYGYGNSRYKRSTDSSSLAFHRHGGPVLSSVPDTYFSVHQPASVKVGNPAPYSSTMQHSAPGFTSHLPAYTSIYHSAPVEAMNHLTPVQVKKEAPALHVSSPVVHVSGHVSPSHVYTLPASHEFYTHA